MAFILNTDRNIVYPLQIGSVPVYVPSSGSIGDNGALTLTTALPVIFPDIFLYFPANAVYAGSVAGKYYCVMSSTTVGVIYDDVYTSGDPIASDTPTPIIATGPGAYTQTTGSDIDLIVVPLPTHLFDSNRWILHQHIIGSYANSAGIKTFRFLFGTGEFMTSNVTTTDTTYLDKPLSGSKINQYAHNSNANGGGNATPITKLSTDITADTMVKVITRINAVTDFSGITMYLTNFYKAG